MNAKIKSPWILHYNCGSCNGCDIEFLASFGPKYDLERFGIINKGNPKQADIFVVTGPVTKRTRARLLRLYMQIPEPKVVIALGTCACTGGAFRHMYNVENGVDRFIPVDVYVPGCAARPEAFLKGIKKALEIWKTKTKDSIEVPVVIKKEFEETLSKMILHGQVVDRRKIINELVSKYIKKNLEMPKCD